MLLSYAWQDDFCFPAQVRLADDLGIGERTVRQYLTELKEAGLITWKQRGLNRPNIYRILKLPAFVTPRSDGHPGPADSAEPDRNDSSGQDRHPASTYKDTRNNTQVVNVNDPQKSSSSKSHPTSKALVGISDRALRSKYNLTDEQIGHVHYLVDRQTEILGSRDRNHAHYVKRAAEAIRDGQGDFLELMLGDFKQGQTALAVGSRPAYFHAMYAEALEKSGTDEAPPPLPSPQPTNLEDSRARLIADAEKRGFPVPDHIRNADIRAVNHWWAALPDKATQRQ